MLEYEWGQPSPDIFAGGEEPNSQVSDPTRIQIFDHYSQNFNEATFLNPNDFAQNHDQYLHSQPHYNSLYEPRAYGGECTAYAPPPPALQLEPVVGLSSENQTGFMVMPKAEPVGCGVDFMASRIGLNLGGRTYFSSAEDDFVNRLYRRSRPFEAGLVNSPRCQAEGCNADLTHAKHYHRRHKVCEFHSKASTVIAAGLTQRFCQQCSRFHLLSEFDNGKRSCRKRLADHNRRRRKSSQQQAQAQAQPAHNTSQISTSNAMVSKNVVTRSPPDSAAQSSSSVTVAVSPTRISVNFLPRRSSSSASTSLVYF